MKRFFLFCLLTNVVCHFAFSQPTAPESEFIKVDQFGYLPDATKVAVISNPQLGYNAGLSFSAGNTYQLRDWQTNNVVFSASPQLWNGGNTHSQSGDSGWWFDFSSVSTPGNYYVYDVANNLRSYQFNIDENVYSLTLKAAMRMFFYNRCNFAKQAPYAEPGFTDAIAFSNNLQDGNSRYIFSQNDAASEKNLTGGWFDAGDFNKYVTFADRVMHDLLRAYEENTSIFTDNFNIPESGNGIPDIIDELKWELDWLMKMNNADGSTHLKMGSKNYSDNTATPPSLNTDPRYYGPTCTAASISVAGVFAHAAKVFQNFPAYSSYAQQLRNRAIASWNYALPLINSNQLETTCDNGEIISGDADWDAVTQQKKALKAAIYLFDLTANNTYHQFITANAGSFAANQVSNAYWDVYEMPLNDALLLYSTLPGANSTLASNIQTSFANAAASNGSGFFGFNNADLYRAFMPDAAYHWGSNLTKAAYGVLNTILVNYNINPSGNASYSLKAAEQLHYFHGINPLNITYLTNMGSYGAENSATEVYHQWFLDGSDWDNSLTSLYGPAPGYVPGGPNKDFSLTSPSPPANQPPQKSYANFNSGYPTSSWEITEPAIYYQSIYVRLLANFAGQLPNCLPANTACDDGDPNTENDVANGNCACEGTLIIPDDCELIVDGTFDGNLEDNWYWWNCAPTINSAVCVVENIVAGTDPWDAALAQRGLVFENGQQYSITFDASASAARSLSIKTGLSVAPFTLYYFDDINLSTTSQSYMLTFTMTDPTTVDGSLEFYMGGSPISFKLDNVNIESMNCCLPSGTACDDGDPSTINDMEDGMCGCYGTPPDCNQILNGTFDTTVDEWIWWNCNPASSFGFCYVGGIIPGTNPWDAAVAQYEILYQQGKQYQITFDAFAAVNRSITIKMGLGIAPFTGYHTEQINLSTSTQSYTINFTMADPTTSQGTLEFYLGGIAGDVIFDNVILKTVNCEVQSCPQTITLNNSVSNFLYEAESNITSDANVAPGGDVHFHAGSRINLSNNFSVPVSATFRAAIAPCGTAVQ